MGEHKKSRNCSVINQCRGKKKGEEAKGQAVVGADWEVLV